MVALYTSEHLTHLEHLGHNSTFSLHSKTFPTPLASAEESANSVKFDEATSHPVQLFPGNNCTRSGS